MPQKHHPRTKAGKTAKVGKVLGEFRRGKLRSSSGAKVVKRRQAVAIAMSASGQSKPPKRRKR
jgi:hypothetical protein